MINFNQTHQAKSKFYISVVFCICWLTITLIAGYQLLKPRGLLLRYRRKVPIHVSSVLKHCKSNQCKMVKNLMYLESLPLKEKKDSRVLISPEAEFLHDFGPARKPYTIIMALPALTGIASFYTMKLKFNFPHLRIIAMHNFNQFKKAHTHQEICDVLQEYRATKTVYFINKNEDLQAWNCS